MSGLTSLFGKYRTTTWCGIWGSLGLYAQVLPHHISWNIDLKRMPRREARYYLPGNYLLSTIIKI